MFCWYNGTSAISAIVKYCTKRHRELLLPRFLPSALFSPTQDRVTKVQFMYAEIMSWPPFLEDPGRESGPTPWIPKPNGWTLKMMLSNSNLRFDRSFRVHSLKRTAPLPLKMAPKKLMEFFRSCSLAVHFLGWGKSENEPVNVPRDTADGSGYPARKPVEVGPVVEIPLCTGNVIYTSKRWLALGFLNHQ